MKYSGQKYEVYYYREVGLSDPLSTKEDVRKLLEAEGMTGLTDEDLEPGKSFMDGNGNLILISMFDDFSEEAEE